MSAVRTARVLAHYAEVNARRSELLNMIRAGAVPAVPVALDHP